MKSSRIVLTLLVIACFAPFIHADDLSQRTAAAEEMMKAMHTEEILSRQKENMNKMMQALLPKNMTDEARQKAMEKQSAIYDNLLKWDSLKPDFIQIYSEVFTEQEMKALTAFYQSPIGGKFIEKMPELQKKTMEIMQKRMITAIPQLQKGMRDSLDEAKAASVATTGSASPTPVSTPAALPK